MKTRHRDTGPTRKTRMLVLERDEYACVACGRSIAGGFYSIQHRQARGMGGTSDRAVNSPVNLVVLCGSATTPGSCHLACEKRDEEMHARGYWLQSGEDPALVPVMVFSEHGSGLMAWLTHDGGYVFEQPEAGAA